MTGLVIAVGACLLLGLALVPTYHRRHVRVSTVAHVRTEMAQHVWPAVDQDLKQPHDASEPPTVGIVRPRRTVVLSATHPQRHGAPKHRRVA